MPKIFVSTYPFGKYDPKPKILLNETNFEIIYNPLNRKLKPEELLEFARDADGLIAGTEKLDLLIEKNSNLKFISRVGIGLDNVPLEICKEKNIRVSYTPDAVTDAVTELTLGLMIDISRKVSFSDREIRQGNWTRPVGKRITESVIGIIGVGRVGKKLIELLSSFQPKKILLNDIQDLTEFIKKHSKQNLEIFTKEKIFASADIISLHIPLYSKTKNLICKSVLENFNPEAYLINTARGELCNEEDLFNALQEKKFLGAALDVFSEEPYFGKLRNLESVLLTQHMGSCSYDCRMNMELQATEEIIRFFKTQNLLREVPEEEYKYQNGFA